MPSALATDPCHGTARLRKRPENGRPGIVEIDSAVGHGKRNTQVYLLEVVRDNGKIVGYRLVRDEGEYEVSHFVDRDMKDCDCQDKIYHPERPGGCRHLASLKALVSAHQRGESEAQF